MVHLEDEFVGRGANEFAPSRYILLHGPRLFFFFKESHDSLGDGLGFRDERYDESDCEAVGDGETGFVEETDSLIPEQPHGEDGRYELHKRMIDRNRSRRRLNR